MPLEHDLVTAINDELTRIQQRERVQDHHPGRGDRVDLTAGDHGNATLSGSGLLRDFTWFGPAAAILERLRRLPTGNGPEAIRSEFS